MRSRSESKIKMTRDRWENYFCRWENYFGKWENYFGGQFKRPLLLVERIMDCEDFFLLDWSPPDESFNKETWDSIRNSCNVWPSVLNFFSFDLSPAFLGCPITRASLDIWFEALLSRPLSATQTLTRFCLHIAPYCGQDQG